MPNTFQKHPKIDLSIVIVTWNVCQLLEKCLRSIFMKTSDLEFEVIVVDNNSQDNTKTMVGNEFPQARLIVNAENLGFAKANNIGIKKARGEFILILNPDTEILENSLKKTVKFMEKNPDVAVTGVKLLNPDGSLQPSVRRFPTPLSQTLLLLKIYHLFPQLKVFTYYLAKDFDYNKTQEVDQIMGAFMMIRNDIFREVGLFDENFYLWFEEVDFCKRVKKACQKVVYFPGSQIIHHRNQSFKQVFKFKRQFLFYKSALRYFNKHH